jgi:hypothetical protein
VLGTLVLAVAACASEASEPLHASDDVATACDRLEDLTAAILGARNASSAEQFAGAVIGPQRAFLLAAVATGDDRLADLARTYDEQFTAWRTGTGLDAREAATRADAALDRARPACTELGADNVFPREPG